MIALLTTVFWAPAPSSDVSAAAPPGGALEASEPDRGRVIAELKAFLEGREKELARLVKNRRRQFEEADALAQIVESQKSIEDPNWLEKKALEKNLAKLRTLMGDIEDVTEEERSVREEAFASAAAIVAELETELAEQLGSLRSRGREGRDGAVERVMALEKTRRTYQRKMNALTPNIPVPGELPKGIPWTREMVEDQRRAYEANIARLQSEREQVVQEIRLRKSLEAAVPNGASGEHAIDLARLRARVDEYDRKIARYRDKLEAMSKRERS